MVADFDLLNDVLSVGFVVVFATDHRRLQSAVFALDSHDDRFQVVESFLPPFLGIGHHRKLFARRWVVTTLEKGAKEGNIVICIIFQSNERQSRL